MRKKPALLLHHPVSQLAQFDVPAETQEDITQYNTVKITGSALKRVHNSRRPLDCLQYGFALCDAVTLTFDLLT